ncbi:flagellar basal-body MS-ring/collar protein FliF [Legionella worsleiensis]|uniref:Flagellar M-ring protein n=1 Tax=Legionella worsleiensis TaxID=45076 RepID=A0A0W1A5Z0_9GAMM|nr:flagellar basal-body MS-ring/collar protein FliF [Legionella worsleiensis]KTD76775.1 flagellar MS-ring protein [Legionella worsleiensis]STY30593.1 flagellar M-ring protein FliF [Legionella worsleiensis]
MNYLQQIQLWFDELTIQRKLGLTCSLLLILAFTSFISWWLLAPTYDVLFNHLEEQDANKIITQLGELNIAYQLKNGGSDILIDKNLIAQTRLKIMGSGVQLTGSVGFELFDKSDFGMTEFSQKINYQRALQGELERTISSLEEVRQARVHLVIPENHLFAKSENQPKAAVTLNLKNRLTIKQIQSIQQLVAASLAHLTAQNVTVVDQSGNTLSHREENDSSSHFKTKQRVERYLNDKVTQMLHTVFTHQHVMVKVDAAINYDELQRELIKPQTQGLITHEKEIKHSSTGKTEKDKQNQDITTEKSYQLGSEKELFRRASGTIERLTVSVIVPQDTPSQTLDQIRNLVKSTVGFNEQRGDVINVEALITSDTSPVTEAYHFSPKPVQHSDFHIPPYFWLLGFTLSTATLLLVKKARNKKRQRLLIELTQWLSHHES